MQSIVVVLGTGGTIAGVAAQAGDDLTYRSAELGVDTLVASVPELAELQLETEQVAQVDSKDMTHAIWQALAARVAFHLARDEVAGLVITHGTDTIEETAYLLHRLLAPAKPVVLTGAMRPASSRQADGPRNLADAVTLARDPASGAHGVLVVMGATVHGAADIRKTHANRIDAFGSGDVGPLARFEQGRLHRLRAWPLGTPLGIETIGSDPDGWPAVEIVTSHAGASGVLVDLLVRGGAAGIVVAATGNGGVHAQLERALQRAAAAGVLVLRATRCGDGAILEPGGPSDPALPSAGALTPAKARVELLLQTLSRRAAGA